MSFALAGAFAEVVRRWNAHLAREPGADAARVCEQVEDRIVDPDVRHELSRSGDRNP